MTVEKKYKVFWTVAIPIGLISFGIVIIALTDVYPDNPFTDYRTVVVILSLSVVGILKSIYRKSKQSAYIVILSLAKQAI